MNDVTTAENSATAQTPSMEALAAAIPQEQPAEQSASAQQPTQQPAQRQQASQPGSEMQQFLQQQAAETESLKAQLAQVQAGQDELQNSLHRDAVNKAVDDAIRVINEKADGDPDMAEFFLSKAYNNDPNLQRIFAARESYPEAYKQALGLLAKEWEAKNQVKIDPQVAENQRALKDSQQASGGQPNQPSAEEQMEKMPDGEFFAMGMRMANNQ